MDTVTVVVLVSVTDVVVVVLDFVVLAVVGVVHVPQREGHCTRSLSPTLILAHIDAGIAAQPSASRNPLHDPRVIDVVEEAVVEVTVTDVVVAVCDVDVAVMDVDVALTELVVTVAEVVVPVLEVAVAVEVVAV